MLVLRRMPDFEAFVSLTSPPGLLKLMSSEQSGNTPLRAAEIGVMRASTSRALVEDNFAVSLRGHEGKKAGNWNRAGAHPRGVRISATILLRFGKLHERTTRDRMYDGLHRYF